MLICLHSISAQTSGGQSSGTDRHLLILRGLARLGYNITKKNINVEVLWEIVFGDLMKKYCFSHLLLYISHLQQLSDHLH